MMLEERRLREEIVRVGQMLYAKDFVCASDGNISARLGRGRFLITPSGLHKGLLEPDQLLVVDADGRRVDAGTPANRDLRPTSELPMHLEAYHQRPDVQAVVHAHPPIAIALTIANIPLDEYLLPEAIVFLGRIPTAPYSMPSSEENAYAIRTLITRHDAIVLERHGSLTVGRSVIEAFMRLETLEQHARIALLATQLGNRRPLAPEHVERLLALRRQMGLEPGSATAVAEADTLPVDTAELRAIVARVVEQTLGQRAY